MPTGNIIVADDDAAIRTVLSQALSRAGYEVRTTGTVAGLWRSVASGEGGALVADEARTVTCLDARGAVVWKHVPEEQDQEEAEAEETKDASDNAIS